MNPSPITLDLDRDHTEFAAFLMQDKKTPEQFETELLPLLNAFIDTNRRSIDRVLVRVETDQLYVTVGLSGQTYDFELSDSISKFLLSLFVTTMAGARCRYWNGRENPRSTP